MQTCLTLCPLPSTSWQLLAGTAYDPSMSTTDDDRSRLAAESPDFLAGSLADDAPEDPCVLVDVWQDDAFIRRSEHGDLPDPTAVVLSTVAFDAEGTPSPRSRTVLLKGRDARGFVLYTNLGSAKGEEIATAPRAALLMPWYPLQRQVRIEGMVEELTSEESDAYFGQRPRGSQIGAWASQQSRPIGSREELETQYAEAEERFEGTDVPRPPYWGGIRVVPERIEFWQGRENRLHDRLAYRRLADGSWNRTRLQP